MSELKDYTNIVSAGTYRLLTMISPDIWAHIITISITSEPYYKHLDKKGNFLTSIEDDISLLITGINSLLDLFELLEIHSEFFEYNNRFDVMWDTIRKLKCNPPPLNNYGVKFNYWTIASYKHWCYSCFGDRKGGFTSDLFPLWISYLERYKFKVCESCAYIHHRFFVPKSLALKSGLLEDFLEQSLSLCLKIDIEYEVNGKMVREIAYEPSLFFHVCQTSNAAAYYILKMHQDPSNIQKYEMQMANHGTYRTYFTDLFGRRKTISTDLTSATTTINQDDIQSVSEPNEYVSEYTDSESEEERPKKKPNCETIPDQL